MAKVIDESLKKQLSKKMVHFLKYFPVRIKNVGEDAVAARNLIWAFKDSRDDAYEKVAQMTADHLQEEFGEQYGVRLCSGKHPRAEPKQIRTFL